VQHRLQSRLQLNHYLSFNNAIYCLSRRPLVLLHKIPSTAMHFLKGLVASLLPFTALAAKKPATVDRFQQYHTKALSSTPLKLDDAQYGKLTTAPRDYSVAILLTALDARYGCQMCREFQPEWELLSKSWTKGDKKGESRLIYGTLDFTDGKTTFQSVRR
jgi:oligosaccharyltransferase complex subunit gamma